MNAAVIRILLLLSFVLVPASYSPLDAQQRMQGSKKFHTQVQLLADVASVQPGVPFTAGLLLRMDKGWHTYWQNAGETGLATHIDWHLPAGFVAGPVQWPVPRKQIETGDILTFGYGDETMLLVSITPPASIRSGTTVPLDADVSWLECERMCVPGSARVTLSLPVSESPGIARNQDFFARFRALLPRPADADSDIVLTTLPNGANLELHIRPAQGARFSMLPDAVPDFYPEESDQLIAGRTSEQGDSAGATVVLPLSAVQKLREAMVLRGVLVYQMISSPRRAVEVEIPLSKEFCASLPVAGTEAGATSLLDRTFITGQAAGGQPLLLTIVFALIGGLLLNIMPCVLPVIALKVFGLVRMAGDQPRRVRKLGWFFSLGILASFLSLALLVIILQAAGRQVGWGFQFQEPLFVVAMCAVVFAFGLSLFGVYEIQMPAVAVAGVSGVIARQEGRRGYGASFWEGVFATILATPCTAPFLGSALGFAFSQSPGIILLIFTAVALGMALPYLLLTTKPAWLKFVPKPGEWMVTAKQFMGFLMMATLIWLLYVLGKQLGMEAVIWTAAFLLVVGMACWLVGRFATLTASRSRVTLTWVAAVLLVAAGYWVFLESALDIRSVIAGTSGPPAGTSVSSAEGIPWQPFTLEGVESGLKENKALFIDFTAEWCLTCKVNEHAVLSDPKVVEKFRTSHITPVRADWTNRNPGITRLLAKFGRSGVPLYVLFPAGKPDAPFVLPEVITTGIVIDAIDRAAGDSVGTLSQR